MEQTTRARALAWPYRRHRNFEQSMQMAASAWFRKRNYATHKRYPYMLERWDDWEKNILLPEVVSYIESERSSRQQNQVGFPLHKYVHHGLSSQAMLFNLVGPLIVRQDIAPLRTAVERTGLVWPMGDVRARFEVEDREVFNEDFGQPTSIDLTLEGASDSPSLFIETKLVERRFGGCSVFADGDCDGANPVGGLDSCYLHYIRRRYWSRLAEFGFLEGAIKTSPLCILSQHYQFFRELLFALAKGGSFVLLYDQRNPSFYREGDGRAHGLVPFLMGFVPDTKQSRVQSISIQAVVQSIRESGRHGDWIDEFASKYGMV